MSSSPDCTGNQEDLYIHVICSTCTSRITYKNWHTYICTYYMIKFGSDLRQVSGFLRALRFPPPIKLTAMVEPKYR